MLCHCDNQAVVAAIRGGYIAETQQWHIIMLRGLFYLEVKRT